LLPALKDLSDVGAALETGARPAEALSLAPPISFLNPAFAASPATAPPAAVPSVAASPGGLGIIEALNCEIAAGSGVGGLTPAVCVKEGCCRLPVPGSTRPPRKPRAFDVLNRGERVFELNLSSVGMVFS